MERIWPFGRMFAVPPPLSETCLPGAGRFTPLLALLLPPLLMLPEPGLPIPDVAPGFPLPGLLVFPVPGRLVPGLAPFVVPGLPVVVPGFPVVVDGRAPVVGWLVEGLAAGFDAACGAAGLGADGVFF